MNKLYRQPNKVSINQLNNKEFFKIIPPTQLKNRKKPSLQNYQNVLQVLKNRNYLYLDFNKKQNDSLILLEKTLSPTKYLSSDNEDEDINDYSHNIQSLGNQYILDVNQLSGHSFKMKQYVSQGKRLMNKKKNINEIQKSFIKQFQQKHASSDSIPKIGSVFRKRQQKKNKKLQYSNKISPEVILNLMEQKLEEYLENKKYHKIQRKLQKSEQDLEKKIISIRQLNEKEKQTQNIDAMQKADLALIKRKHSLQLKVPNHTRYENFHLRQTERIMKCPSEQSKNLSKQLTHKIKFPKIEKLASLLAESFSAR